LRVFVIDDSREFVRLLTLQLRAAGHEASGYTTGADGLAALRRDPPDALITDIFMPGTDGLEVIRACRAEYPQLKIVAISGGGEQLSASFALDMAGSLGADHVLAKPFSREELMAALPAGQPS
jgi:CheY-like chemotaxis protein